MSLTLPKFITKNHKNCAIIFPDDSCNSLGVIRGLAQQGIPVLFLSVTGREISAKTRYATTINCPDPKKEEQEFIHFVNELATNLTLKGVFFPVNDLGVKFLCKFRKVLEESFLLVNFKEEASQILLNKKEFFKVLSRLNVPIPKTYFIDETDPFEAFKNIPKPFIIKPNDSELFQRFFKEKCVEIADEDDFSKYIHTIIKENINVVFQEIIPGNNIYMFNTYIDKEGRVLAICGYEKLRQFPVEYGSGALVKTKIDQTAIDMGLKVIENIGYIGLAESEMKYDPRDHKYKFIEINPRSTTQNRLPAKMGVDYEFMAYREALGEPLEAFGYLPEGTKWVDLRGYLFSILPKLPGDNLSFWQWLRGLKGEMVFAVFDFRDPMPFVHSFLPEVKRLVSKIIPFVTLK